MLDKAAKAKSTLRGSIHEDLLPTLLLHLLYLLHLFSDVFVIVVVIVIMDVAGSTGAVPTNGTLMDFSELQIPTSAPLDEESVVSLSVDFRSPPL